MRVFRYLLSTSTPNDWGAWRRSTSSWMAVSPA